MYMCLYVCVRVCMYSVSVSVCVPHECVVVVVYTSGFGSSIIYLFTKFQF